LVLLFYKDSASRKQSRVYSDYVEAQPIFYKDTANREQRHQTCLNGYAECSLSSTKIIQDTYSAKPIGYIIEIGLVLAGGISGEGRDGNRKGDTFLRVSPLSYAV